ncbi:MAG: glycerate kinase [Gammaproteobacteria bacterium]|nr:glycerate kinase [Gammaproteobacteria bacterium]
MNILIAPDSFKGSLSAAEFCHIVADQIHCSRADVNIHLMPLADGGEGSIEAILANTPGKTISTSVHNPLGQTVDAVYAILDNQTAVIEMAQASGLPMLAPHERNPMLASSYGTGELIIAGLDQGCRRFIIGLGGSATNDAGMGMLQALGVKFLNAGQQAIKACGQALKDIESIDLSGIDPRIQGSEFIIAGDVTNPLCGEQGATYTYGPQKGADSQMLAELEAGIKHFAEKTGTLPAVDRSLANAAGAGAAGGMGYALMAYCQANMKSGFELIAEMADLDGVFADVETRPDLIITGEGRFDSQSIQGKLVGRLSEYADKYNIPMLVICGSIGEDLDMNAISQNISTFSICHGPSSLEYTMNNTAVLLDKLISNLLKVLFIDCQETRSF